MTKNKKSLIILFVFGHMVLFAQKTPDITNVCVSKFEKALYDKIMEYRKGKKLPIIHLSKSLTLVAQAHVKDLVDNHPDIGNCNMHSWSNKGGWTACCYTDDHKAARQMWNKPKEIAGYPGYGYEIAYNISLASENPEEFASEALDSWKGSSGHVSVILNKAPWNSYLWQAIGIGIYNGYAVVWFGVEKDLAENPKICDK